MLPLESEDVLNPSYPDNAADVQLVSPYKHHALSIIEAADENELRLSGGRIFPLLEDAVVVVRVCRGVVDVVGPVIVVGFAVGFAHGVGVVIG